MNPQPQGPGSTRHGETFLVALAFLLACAGALRADSIIEYVAYLLVVLASIAPTFVWLRSGDPGIPVLPAIGLGCLPYYAWPILGGDEVVASYLPSEVFDAAMTVCLYLGTATLVWRLMIRRMAPAPTFKREHIEGTRVTRLLLTGLYTGVIFHIGLNSGWFVFLGPYFGVVRSVAVTFLMAACFMVGVMRARGVLRGGAWTASLIALILIIVLSISSLFLIGGLTYALAVALGYVIVTRKVPWVAVAIVLSVATVLHAGKGQMRLKYWDQDANYGSTVTLFDLPEFALDWIREGLHAFITPNDGATILGRASLLHMILRAETDTPDRVDYLNGETYALLPAVVLPRFIDADKPASQAGMDLLNVRYGLLTVEGTASTAIGWGLIAEGYANFGFSGVVGIAIIIGAFCGVLSIWSTQSKVDSLPSLMSIAAMMTLINLEADFVALASSLLQSFFSVIIFFAIYRLFERPRADDGLRVATR